MSTQNTPIVAEEVTAIHIQEGELKDALNIVELEERFEMTAVAAESSRCTYSESAAA